jgi:hypothetical protein
MPLKDDEPMMGRSFSILLDQRQLIELAQAIRDAGQHAKENRYNSVELTFTENADDSLTISTRALMEVSTSNIKLA